MKMKRSSYKEERDKKSRERNKIEILETYKYHLAPSLHEIQTHHLNVCISDNFRGNSKLEVVKFYYT
jgi:hypothetical protein